MCTDFIDLNKCCPEDNFPVSRIDQIVNTSARSKTMALLHYFSGYPQIWLRKDDEEKTSFITSFRTYCYLRMSEGLRNASPTFYRKVLSYVGDIVMVSKKRETYISDLAETFVNMHGARLKLNLEKCIFGITKGKVLGCLVSNKGIESNPDKIRSIT
jgi:hypothetical protein